MNHDTKMTSKTKGTIGKNNVDILDYDRKMYVMKADFSFFKYIGTTYISPTAMAAYKKNGKKCNLKCDNHGGKSKTQWG